VPKYFFLSGNFSATIEEYQQLKSLGVTSDKCPFLSYFLSTSEIDWTKVTSSTIGMAKHLLENCKNGIMMKSYIEELRTNQEAVKFVLPELEDILFFVACYAYRVSEFNMFPTIFSYEFWHLLQTQAQLPDWQGFLMACSSPWLLIQLFEMADRQHIYMFHYSLIKALQKYYLKFGSDSSNFFHQVHVYLKNKGMPD